MPKDAYINARVDKTLKAKAEKVLRHVGVTTTDAINMLLHQIVLQKGLPFDVRVVATEDEMSPNALRFEIEGALWAQPIPERLYLQTEIDLETGSVSVVELA